MKILLLLFLTIIFPAEALETFNNEIEKGYESYRVITDYDNNYYHLKIVQGINNDEVNLGIYFYNHNSRADLHTLQIVKNNRKYSLETNRRNDINIPAIAADDDIIINIYDAKGTLRGSSIIIKEINTEEFINLNVDVDQGLNQGIAISTLKRNRLKLSVSVIIMILFLSIIVIFGVIILILFFTKKGMFSEKRRMENVFNFKEFINTLPREENFNSDDEIRLDESEYEEVKPVYERQRDYYEDEEDEVDITQLLKSKGYNVDYQNASEAEKNDIMLELMKLRDFKDITYEQYQNEVIKLWRK